MTSPPKFSIVAAQDDTTVTVTPVGAGRGRPAVTVRVSPPESDALVLRLSQVEAVWLAHALRSATSLGCDSGHIADCSAGPAEDWNSDPRLDRQQAASLPWDWQLRELQNARRLGRGDQETVAAALVREYSYRIAHAVLAAYPSAGSLVVELHDVPPYPFHGGALVAVLDRKGRAVAPPAAEDDGDTSFGDLDAVLDGLLAEVVAVAPEGSGWHGGRRVLDLTDHQNW